VKLLYPLAKRFIAGYDFESAKPKIDELVEEGFEVSIDYVGELSKNIKDCSRAAKQYIEISDHYSGKKIDISIKPTQLGLGFDPKFCEDILFLIVKRAESNGHTIRLDMEDSSVTQLTIDLCIRIKKHLPNIGVAMQANLLRSVSDFKILLKNNISIRLVKGAYKEDKEIAIQNDWDLESSFFDFAAKLYSSKANKPAIATHDEDLLSDITEMITDPKYFDYEFLYGIRRDLQRSFRDMGHSVRIYVPFGTDWLPYVLRRLKEWKNLKFVFVNIVKELFKK
jgi:proline dehydrogenase